MARRRKRRWRGRRYATRQTGSLHLESVQYQTTKVQLKWMVLFIVFLGVEEAVRFSFVEAGILSGVLLGILAAMTVHYLCFREITT